MGHQKTMALMKRLYRDQIDGTTEFYELIQSHLRPRDYVLDLGCGIGRRETDLRYGPHFVIGCDVSDNLWKNQFVCAKAQASAYQLPFKDQAFDAILMDYVLEHLEFPDQCAKELFRVLRSDGRLFFRTPNLFHYVSVIARFTPHSFHRKAVQWIGESPELEPFETFYRVNTRKAAMRCFGGVGFVVEKLEMVEKEPSYLTFSRFGVFVGYLYERSVNRSGLFAQLRSNIFGFFRKPS